MNNYQWLLQMDGADRKAWFDAEHVETEERALDGDTEPENEDSREQLEADAFAYLQTAYITYPQIIELLDRQAAITAHQWESYHNGMMLEWMAKTEELQEQVDELTSERDKLQEQLRIGWECECRLQAERDHYRSKFGKCLDYADAIHALMDDEGMA